MESNPNPENKPWSVEPATEIAINTISFSKEWEDLARAAGNPHEVVARIMDEYRLVNVEVLDHHLGNDPGNIESIARFYRQRGKKIFAVGPPIQLLEAPEKHDTLIKKSKDWLKLASDAGIPNVRFNIGDGPVGRILEPTPDFDEEDWEDYHEMIDEALVLTGRILEPLIGFAEQHDVSICIETHKSYSSNKHYIEKFEKLWSSDNLGWIYDIGNFESNEMRWDVLDLIKKNIKYIHGKTYKFDKDGLEQELDYLHMARVLHDAGFQGTWSIETKPGDGKGDSILWTLQTLHLCRHAIAAAAGGTYMLPNPSSYPTSAELFEKFTG